MFSDRLALYEKLEEKRQSKVLVYVTGTKQGMEAKVASDATEYFVEHLDKLGIVPRITLVLHTAGGETLAAWNIVNLIKQFCDDFEIVVPSMARSAGTLMCLAANRIIMTKQATLGPIDPSINNPLNPSIEGAGPMAKVPVSVEAIRGFIALVKQEIGIKDDIAVASIISKMTDKLHPLVLGEVYRATSQIQMLAEKLLVNQITDEEKIRNIVSFLCSESGSHDYTINRREARSSLGLVVETPDEELYEIINNIYKDFKNEMDLANRFDPVNLLSGANQCKYEVKRCLIESISGCTDAFVSEGVLTRFSVPGQPNQLAINDERRFEGWRHYEHIRN